jgi:hypothetical protein
MGYLNRMGFSDHLAPDIEVLPARPAYSAAEIHRGGNQSLVEIARINKSARDEELPTRLTAALMRSCGNRPDAQELEGAAWTILAELHPLIRKPHIEIAVELVNGRLAPPRLRGRLPQGCSCRLDDWCKKQKSKSSTEEMA